MLSSNCTHSFPQRPLLSTSSPRFRVSKFSPKSLSTLSYRIRISELHHRISTKVVSPVHPARFVSFGSSFWITCEGKNVYEGDKPFAQRENKLACELKLLKSLAPPLMTALIAFSPIVNPPVSVGKTIDVQKGAALFNRACIGCHYAGGNIIQPGATLFWKDLQRNGVDTEEEIYRVTYSGKGRMPGFGQNCTPRGQCTFGPRLQDDEIKLLAEFVKSQADQGWPKIENSGD